MSHTITAGSCAGSYRSTGSAPARHPWCRMLPDSCWDLRWVLLQGRGLSEKRETHRDRPRDLLTDCRGRGGRRRLFRGLVWMGAPGPCTSPRCHCEGGQARPAMSGVGLRRGESLCKLSPGPTWSVGNGAIAGPRLDLFALGRQAW